MKAPTAFAPSRARAPTPAWSEALGKASDAADIRSGPRTAMTGAQADFASTDILTKLPAKAARKLRELRTDVEELSMLGEASFDQRQEVMLAKQSAQARVDILTDPGAAARTGQTDIYTTDHPSVIAARRDLDKLSAQLETMDAQAKARQARRSAHSSLLRAVERYLATTPLSAIAPVEIEPPSLVGDPPSVLVEIPRQKRRELLADLRVVETAPIHSSVAKAKARAEIEALAEKGKPNIYPLLEGGRSIGWPKENVQLELSGFAAVPDTAPRIYGVAGGTVDSNLARDAWLHKEKMIEKIEALFSEAANDQDALTDEERAERSAEILDQVLACERMEEAYCEMAYGAIVRRPDLDPRAFLTIDGPAPRGD